MKKYLISLVFLFPMAAQARVFNINTETLAAYLRGNWGPSLVQKSAFEKASSNNETYDAAVKDNFAGEFGFIYTSRYLGFRFGIEVIRPASLKTLNATNAGGTLLYQITSDVSAVVPKFGLEFNLKQWQRSRLFLNANYGAGNVSVTNVYYFTAAGTAAIAGNPTDYTEEGKGTATSIDGAFGFETLMFDTTTIVFEAGYRSLKFSDLTHNRAATTIQGAKAKGDAFLNADGSKREIDFTGYVVGLSFRFWL